MKFLRWVLFCFFVFLSKDGYDEARSSVPKESIGLYDVCVVEFRLPERWVHIFRKVCEISEVPVWLLARIAEEESGFNPKAVGKNKNGTVDRGMFQHNSQSIPFFSNKYLCVDSYDPHNVEIAAFITVEHLSDLYQQIGSWRGAIIAYNCGINAYRRNGGPKKSRAYVDSILRGVENMWFSGKKIRTADQVVRRLDVKLRELFGENARAWRINKKWIRLNYGKSLTWDTTFLVNDGRKYFLWLEKGGAPIRYEQMPLGVKDGVISID